MSETAFSTYLAQYTLEKYETEFADRHLLHGAIAKWAHEHPDEIAIHEFDTGRDYTYGELEDLTTVYALELIELGFRPGDFLATLLPLLAEHIILEYACFKIGVIHAPLDLRLKTPEVVRSLSLIEPKGFAFLGKTSAGDFGETVGRDCPYVEHFLQFAPPGETIDGALAFSDFVAQAAALAEQAALDRDNSPIWDAYQDAAQSVKPTDGAQVIYTTGSTGFPKPALLSHRNITCQNMCLAAGFEMTGDLRMLVNLPPSHVGCQGEQLMTAFFTGGRAVVLHVFDPEKTLKAIEEQKVGCFGQIPAMFNIQWQLPNFDDYDRSSVERVMYGGQQVTAQFVGQLMDRFPKLGTGLGLTEMAGFVTYSDPDAGIDDLVESVGWAMPVTPLTIRQPMKPDGSAGEVLPDGEAGEICFSGPQVFIAYVNNDEAYRKTVSTDGICYTGDLGYKSERGLIFSGRSKLVIKPKGYQVHPAQIEQHFAQLKDQVAACGAVGAAHDVFSEAIVLFVEPKPDATLTRDELEAHAKGIAAYMRPSHYVLLTPGKFPLNRVAKTDYVTLSQLAQSEVEDLRSAGGWDR